MFIKILQIIPIVALIGNSTYGMQSLVGQKNSSIMTSNTSQTTSEYIKDKKYLDEEAKKYLLMLKKYRKSNMRPNIWGYGEYDVEYDAEEDIYDNVRPKAGPTLLKNGCQLIEHKSDTPSDIVSKSSESTSLDSTTISILQKKSNNPRSIGDNLSLANIKKQVNSKPHVIEKTRSVQVK